MSKNNNLNLFYDEEADVLYFSKGKPSIKDISDEISDEIVIRRNLETKEITGFTIMNFSKKSRNTSKSIKLPFEVELKQTAFA